MSMPPKKTSLLPPSPPKTKQQQQLPVGPFNLSTDRRRRLRLSVLKKELEAADAHIIAQRQNYAGWRDATLRVEQQQRENFSGLLSELKDMHSKNDDLSYCRFSLNGIERFSSDVGINRKEFSVTNYGGKKVGIGGAELSLFPSLTSGGQAVDAIPATSSKNTYIPPEAMSLFTSSVRPEEGSPAVVAPDEPRRKRKAKVPLVAGRTPRSELLRQEKREQEKRDEEKEAQEKRDGFKKVDTSRDVAVAQTKSFLLRRDIGEAAAKEEGNTSLNRRPSMTPGSNWAYLSTPRANSSRRLSSSQRSTGGGGGSVSSLLEARSMAADSTEHTPPEGERSFNSNVTPSKRRERASIAFVLDNVETVTEFDEA